MTSLLRLETKTVSPGRADIVAAARLWLGTPYIHQASRRGAGCDCLGLVRGVYRDLYGGEPELPPAYSPDWNERLAEAEPLLSAGARHLIPSTAVDIQPGEVLMFRIVRGGPVKHCGIALGDDRFIHAYVGRAVIDSWLNRWWRIRLAARFDYPSLSPKLPSKD